MAVKKFFSKIIFVMSCIALCTAAGCGKKEADKADKIYYYGNSDGIEAEITAFSDYREYLMAIKGTPFLAGAEDKDTDGYYLVGEIRLFSEIPYNGEESRVYVDIDSENQDYDKWPVLPNTGNDVVKTLPFDMYFNNEEISSFKVIIDDMEYPVELEVLERYMND